jgi:hypothetical protein
LGGHLKVYSDNGSFKTMLGPGVDEFTQKNVSAKLKLVV